MCPGRYVLSLFTFPFSNHVLTPRVAGSNVIVAGTSVFSADKPADVITTLRKAVDDAIAERKQKQ